MLAALTGVLGGKHGERRTETQGDSDVWAYEIDKGMGSEALVPVSPVRSPPPVQSSSEPVDAPVATPGPQPAEVLPLPTVVSSPTEAPSVVEPELGGLESLICAYPWSCETALAIVRCESTFDPNAVGAGSYGLFQIQASVHAWKWPDFWEAWSDPVRNTEYAWEIYSESGWRPWSCA